jgi:hypothetical protein
MRFIELSDELKAGQEIEISCGEQKLIVLITEEEKEPVLRLVKAE